MPQPADALAIERCRASVRSPAVPPAHRPPHGSRLQPVCREGARPTTFVDPAWRSTITPRADVRALAARAKVRRTRAHRMRSRTNLSRRARMSWSAWSREPRRAVARAAPYAGEDRRFRPV